VRGVCVCVCVVCVFVCAWCVCLCVRGVCVCVCVVCVCVCVVCVGVVCVCVCVVVCVVCVCGVCVFVCCVCVCYVSVCLYLSVYTGIMFSRRYNSLPNDVATVALTITTAVAIHITHSITVIYRSSILLNNLNFIRSRKIIFFV